MSLCLSMPAYTRQSNDVTCSRWRSSEGAFALCSYPFLLDADAKSRLLKVDAQAQQAAHFQQSVIMGLLMPTMEASPFLEVCCECGMPLCVG